MIDDIPTCECGSQDYNRITEETVTMSLTWEDGNCKKKESNCTCHESHIECAKCNKVVEADDEEIIEEFFW